MAPNTIKKFHTWLEGLGVEILPVTNPYELIRFRSNDQIGVLYTGKKGYTFHGQAEEAWDHFSQKKPWNPTEKNKIPVMFKGTKIAYLLRRDGDKCFFCKKELGTDVTLEHLLARNVGGSNHINNLALAHKKCNLDAGHLSLMEKIKLRENT